MKRCKLRQLRIFMAAAWILGMTNGKAKAETISNIIIEGNAKVESLAITNLLESKVGQPLSHDRIKKDINTLYKLGYFSDIRFYKEEQNGTTQLIIIVKEKPAITKISFEGLDEISEDDIKKQLETKLFQIVNESTIAADIRLIEKKYEEKGFYLAKATYELQETSESEVSVVFRVDEGGKVLVGDIHILGNEYFSANDIIDKFVLRPYTRSSAYSSSSIYQTDRLNRDLEFLAYYYRDHGFAEVKVARPIVHLDTDKHFVRITFQVEEGLQYNVGSISVSGDVGADLYTQEQLIPDMLLKSGSLFRYSFFSKDIEKLVDKYGDLGYAYVDVNPLTNFNKESQTVDINYQITKGKKIYFGSMNIIGNTKTRDNVIRRELEIADSELYSGTKMTESKNNITRLGYFEEVQVLRERDPEIDDLLHLKIKVKEKPTGQLQAAIGYSPGGETAASGFGQGRYEEKNQSGKGWTTSLTLKYSSATNYQIDTGFSDPRVNDSQWSLGLNYGFEVQETRYAAGIEVPEQRQNISLTVGRDIVELIRGYITLRHSRIRQREEVYVFDGYQSGGIKNSAIFGITRRDLDNYIDPTEGTTVSLRQNFTGGVLRGDYQFMETTLDGDVYVPIDFSDEFRTYIKVHGFIGKLWSYSDEPLPASERYRLGGFNNLRGFDIWSVGPKERRGRSPLGSVYDYNRGGDRQFFAQAEYFLPLIPQAGIKFLFFIDGGRVYNEDEDFTLSDLDYDVGFGFRWITPIAPFRFEWATPYRKETNSFGDMKFIFNIGY